MQKRNKRIGIFDSGFGGLHVLRSIVSALPQYDYAYLGDTARAPYGDRPQETIYAYTKQAVDFLFRHECGIVVIACNTASSEALRRIQDEYGAAKKVLGVLIPAAEVAVERTTKGRIGVIATHGTVASNKFVRELTKLDPTVRVFQNACPLLVPLIESGEHGSAEMETILKRYLDPLLRKKIDTLILGCTHYGILERNIRKVVGPTVHIVSEARVVPKKLAAYFKKHGEIEATLGKRSNIHFYSTDRTDNFKILGSKLFGKKIQVKKATLR
ncbi:TPA: glutamate racemase [Candidatus Kaiserbacteria bacterium]|nr:MAG: Glutamate racemase [Parcubacteria group bacterium GW2011_GWA1_56_13]KKW46097.1 MAG: Glutamate racemase [Parcubacteria group bacterium GW2011_GWB1_57_6]HCR52512.1 glutamate racemase [Candidatus Kaiserbacteria bacterium]